MVSSASVSQTPLRLTLTAALLAPALSLLAAGEPQVLIDTKFDKMSGEKLLVDPLPMSPSELPLTAPTACAANSPSTVLPGKEPAGSIAPPYALVSVRERANSSEAPANTSIKWDLSKCPLEAAKYRIQIRVTPVEFVNDAGNFFVQLSDADGKVPQAPLRLVPSVSFTNGKLQSNHKYGQPVAEGETYLIEMILDLHQLTWSSSVNGEVLQQETPIDPEYLEMLGGSCGFGSFIYASLGGMDNCRPGSVLALADVKMEKID